MNADAAKIVVDNLVNSGFGAMEALLGFSFSVDIQDPWNVSSDEMGSIAAEHSVWMRAKIVGGGAVALTFQPGDAAKLVGLVLGEEGKSELTDDDAAMLTEIADAILGGGIASIDDLFEDQDVELEAIEAVWGKGPADLAEYIGGVASGARIKFSADPHFDSTAAIVYTQAFEERMPGAGGAEPEDAAQDEPLVSEAEMKDILEGFTPDDEPDHVVEPLLEMPENLAIIMDIELVATARLGKIEVPLSEVLNFGPGSIIEVGHSVDEPVDLLVNDKLIARGDVVVVDEKFGLRITEIVSPQERIESLS